MKRVKMIPATSFEVASISAALDFETHANKRYSKCPMVAVDENKNEIVNNRLNGKEVTIKYSS